jgi:PadR family transcriptional regulator PadR
MANAKTKSPRGELLPGTLDMLILKTLTRGALHGYGIARRILEASDEVLKVEEGSLYPALQRLALQGWVSARWALTENNRRARYYELTSAGKKQLGIETSEFDRLTRAIARVMRAT